MFDNTLKITILYILYIIIHYIVTTDDPTDKNVREISQPRPLDHTRPKPRTTRSTATSSSDVPRRPSVCSTGRCTMRCMAMVRGIKGKEREDWCNEHVVTTYRKMMQNWWFNWFNLRKKSDCISVKHLFLFSKTWDLMGSEWIRPVGVMIESEVGNGSVNDSTWFTLCTLFCGAPTWLRNLLDILRPLDNYSCAKWPGLESWSTMWVPYCNKPWMTSFHGSGFTVDLLGKKLLLRQHLRFQAGTLAPPWDLGSWSVREE